jgi:hypothetical protein
MSGKQRDINRAATQSQEFSIRLKSGKMECLTFVFEWFGRSAAVKKKFYSTCLGAV